MTSASTVPRFNLETMSGIFPGTRTKIYQNIYLQPSLQAKRDPGTELVWATVFWTEMPAACLVFFEKNAWGAEDLQTQAETPLVHLTNPHEGNLIARLHSALETAKWQLQSCGTCVHWQPINARNADGLQLGACQQQTTFQVGGPPTTTPLMRQSCLALKCSHWCLRQPVEDAAYPDLSTEIEEAPTTVQTALTPTGNLSLWHRISRLWRTTKKSEEVEDAQPWEEKLLERSGVGAGTEPCFACQARMANLGALVVETEEEDKQTFSIWRCRGCFSYYLNNWIDRWERLDTLETEESYYRIAPTEAHFLLSLVEGVTGGDHPGRRQERGAQRNQILHFLADLSPLSHQIKQGR